MGFANDMATIDPWYLERLVCPVDRTPFEFDGVQLISESGRRYPVVAGIPVLLVDSEDQTFHVARSSIDRSLGRPGVTDERAPELYLETLGIGQNEKAELVRLAKTKLAKIDPVALMLLRATSGNSYKHLNGNYSLKEYPIPEIVLPTFSGADVLDLGCNWGRWSISAARQGYKTVGIDPSLGAIMAARRIAIELGLDVKYIVADGRHLPFRDDSFDCVYSYSVLQHFEKENARKALVEVGRVLKRGGIAKIQMANKWGLRSLQWQLKRWFRPPRNFEVRYWTISEMRAAFRERISEPQITADCYFGLGWQWCDFHLMKPMLKSILVASEALKRMSNWIPALRRVADSVFCTATKL